MICDNPDCNVQLKYQITVQNGESIIKIFQCPKCGASYDIRFYMYTPHNCPKHHWIFDKWGHKGGMNSHETFWIMKCDRCGATNEDIRWDSHAVGLRQAVDLEDPRVSNLLDLNHDTAKYLLPKDDVTDFWKN